MILMISLLCILLLVGCSRGDGYIDSESNPDRFIEIYSSGSGTEYFSIYEDVTTGVQYVVWRGYYKGSITPLLDKNGEVFINPK